VKVISEQIVCGIIRTTNS